jgi:hypothetical protein
LTTEAVAAPLHPLHVAPDKPTVVAPNAREHVQYVREKRGDSQPVKLSPARLFHTFFSLTGPPRAKLRHVNVIGFIEEEIEKEHWDVGRIKVLFRALRITKSDEAIQYIIDNFSRLIVFMKELCLLTEVLEADNWACFDDLRDELIESILKPPASSVQVIRTWLLEIFVRGVVSISLDKFRALENLPSPLDKRQLLLLRGRCDDVNYFRRQKTAIDHFSGFEQPCLVWGASCLPDDEYETWLGSIKPIFRRPLGELFLKWAKQNKDKLKSRLSAIRDEHPD